MNRRGFIKTSALAGGALAIGGTQACKPANVSAGVSTISSFLHDISPLLPAQAQLITKILKVTSDFNAAYQAGKFQDAGSIFANMSDLIDQLTTDIGVSVPPQVKIAIAIVNAAVRAIAVLLKGQATPAIRAAASSPSNQGAAAKIDRLANPAAIDKVYQVLTTKP